MESRKRRNPYSDEAGYEAKSIKFDENTIKGTNTSSKKVFKLSNWRINQIMLPSQNLGDSDESANKEVWIRR